MKSQVMGVGLSVIVLAGCQVGPAPGVDARSVAVVEALSAWEGQTPTPAPGQRLVELPDGTGGHVAALVEPAAGAVIWAAAVPAADGAKLEAMGVEPVRPPPCACRTCCDPVEVAAHLVSVAKEAP